MKQQELIKQIKERLHGDKLNFFIHEENSLKRELDLCKNRLSLYFTALMFFFGWFIAFIYQFVSMNFVESSELVGEVSSNLVSSSGLFSMGLGFFTMAGLIKDMFLLSTLKTKYEDLLKYWVEVIKDE